MTRKELCTLIGMNIRAERHSRGLTIDEFAELLDLSPGFVGLIERGERGVTAYNLLKISRVLGTPTDNFYTHTKTKTPSGVKVL
ncbi:MAG: helix-turn-helix transcriptional regulator [Defluviitaleaceae bacterium]|nr:helix-turn-helix transcriptional regulator [Defluviitaleaceae bacterium]